MFINLFVYMFGRTYVILYFDPRVFVLVMWSTPSRTRITLVIELFTVLNSFAGAVQTRVSGGGKSMRSLSWL